MDFKHVELAREAYLVKSKALTKKRIIASSIAFFILFIIDCAILLANISSFSGLLTSAHSPLSTLAAIMPLFAVLLLEIVAVSVVVFVVTGGNAAAREYANYKHAYKSYFITHQLRNFFTDLNYNHELGLSRAILQDTQLINTGDRYSSNDLVEAKYKDVKFMQADVHIEKREKRTDSEGHTEVYYVTIFKGRFLIFEFPKKFDFKMVVSHNGYERLYINHKTGRGLSRIETESPEFNKRFLVYAEDGFEAFYILNPSFLEELEKLAQKYNNNLALYFSDNKLFVGLNDNGDTFEPPKPSVPIDEEQEKAKVIEDMKLITELVDNLKLSK